MTAVDVGNALARLNAVFNLTSFSFLVAGLLYIRKKRLAAHERCMKLAFTSSALFLVGYLTRYALTGTHRFPGSGPLKLLYLGVLFSHMALAAVTLPLVLRTLYLARGRRFVEHRSIAKVTLPIWLYVSLTGVVVYVMLYHLV